MNLDSVVAIVLGGFIIFGILWWARNEIERMKGEKKKKKHGRFN